MFPVYPVSNAQGIDTEAHIKLEILAVPSACRHAGHVAADRRFKLARDVRAFEIKRGCKLNTAELMHVFNEWYRLSQAFVGSAESREHQLAAFLAELGKVRVPTGECNALNKALEAVSKLSADGLPQIPGMPDAPQPWRRLAALHRELDDEIPV